MERISSFFLMGFTQRSRTSFFNTCMKKNSLFWPTNVAISFNTETSLQVMTWSLVFVLMLISRFIDQNPKCFSRMCWRMSCFSVHNPWEKKLEILSIWRNYRIERVYYSGPKQIIQKYDLNWLKLVLSWPVKSLGSTFHNLVDLFKYDFWYVVVLCVTNHLRWDDLVSLLLLLGGDGSKWLVNILFAVLLSVTRPEVVFIFRSIGTWLQKGLTPNSNCALQNFITGWNNRMPRSMWIL